MYYTYVLHLSNNIFYIGYSSNLKKRIVEHKQGLVHTTKSCRPVLLVYYAAFYSKVKAINFERYLKTPSGFAFRNKHII